MAKRDSQDTDNLDQIRNRMDWIDEERLKSNRRLVQIEQKLSAWEKDLSSRERRLKDLEQKLAEVSIRFGQMSQGDTQFALFKSEMMQQLDQVDKRRAEGDKELGRLHRAEIDGYQRELSGVKKVVSKIGQLENDMQLRASEDDRLNTILGSLQNKILALQNGMETWNQQVKFVEESERTNSTQLSQLETLVFERGKKFETIEARLDVTNLSLTKLQTVTQEVSDSFEEVRLAAKSWREEIQAGEHQRNKRLQDWEQRLEDADAQIEKFQKDWLKYAEQYKDSRMAVQTLGQWQEQIEIRQQEAAELARVESKQLQVRWEEFSLDNEKRWKNFDIDQEQRWSSQQRIERQLFEQIHVLSDLIKEIQEDKDRLWRVQTAQTEALKKWPRIWLEEVEKARSLDPNTRRQPALVPVREE